MAVFWKYSRKIKKNWVWDFISQTLWNWNPPNHYLLSILDFFSLEWRFHLKLEFKGNFYSIMADKDKSQTQIFFYFPGVFPEYYHCQEVLSPYLLPLWRYFQTKMVFLLKMSHFSGDFNSIMADIDKSQTTIFFYFPGVISG